MDKTQKERETIIITKRGIPVARLVPFVETPPSLFGFMANSLEIRGDITTPIEEEWAADVDD